MNLVKTFSRGHCFLVMFFLLSACSAFQSDQDTGLAMDPRIRAEQEAELIKADENFRLGYVTIAREQYIDFQRKFPNSIFFQRARFGQAKSIEAEGRWTEAAEIYRSTIEATRTRQPEIAAAALYHISYCYENLGDESRLLASLKDALNMKQYLKVEQVEAEIPARLAAVYSRMGLTAEAQTQLNLADQGIRDVIRMNPNNLDNAKLKSWTAEVYYRMGLFSTEQISEENLQSALDSFKMVQTFSLRSVEAGAEPWSSLSEQELKKNYNYFWRSIQNILPSQDMDIEAGLRDLKEKKTKFSGQLLTLMTSLSYSRVVSQDLRSPQSNRLFNHLKELEKAIENHLYDQGELNQLTPEALKRNRTKKQGLRLKDPQK